MEILRSKSAALKFILLTIFAAKITIGDQVYNAPTNANDFKDTKRKKAGEQLRLPELKRNRGDIAAVQSQLLSKLEEASKLQNQLYKIIGPLENSYYQTIEGVVDRKILESSLRDQRRYYNRFPTLNRPPFSRPLTTKNNNSKRSGSSLYVPPVGPIQNPNFGTSFSANNNERVGDVGKVFPLNQQQRGPQQQYSGLFYPISDLSRLIPPVPKRIHPPRTPTDYRRQNYVSFPQTTDESRPQLFVNASFQNLVPRVGSQQQPALFIPAPPRPQTIPGSQSFSTLSRPQKFSAEEEFPNFSKRRQFGTTETRRPPEDVAIFPSTTIIDVDYNVSRINQNSIEEHPKGLIPPPLPIGFDGGDEFETSLLPRIEDSEENFQIIESLWKTGKQEEEEAGKGAFPQPAPLFPGPAIPSARTQQPTPDRAPIRRQKNKKNKGNFRLPNPSDYEDDPFNLIQLRRPPAPPPPQSLRLFPPRKPYVRGTTPQPPPYPYPTNRLPFDVDKAPSIKPRGFLQSQPRRGRGFQPKGSQASSSNRGRGRSFVSTATNGEESSNPTLSQAEVERREQFYPSTQPPLLIPPPPTDRFALAYQTPRTQRISSYYPPLLPKENTVRAAGPYPEIERGKDGLEGAGGGPPLPSPASNLIINNPIVNQRRGYFNIQPPPRSVILPPRPISNSYRRYGDNSRRPPPNRIQYPIVPKTSIVQPTWTSTTILDRQRDPSTSLSSSGNNPWQLPVRRPPSPPVYRPPANGNPFQWQTYKPPRTGKAGGTGWSNAVFYGPISISGVPVKGNSNQEKVCITVKIPANARRTTRLNPLIPVAKPRICCKVKGFSRESKRERWFAIGCDVEGTAGCVPWETRYAYPALRCRSNVAKRFVWTHSPTLEALPIKFKGVVY